jgi:hypothetical protein
MEDSETERDHIDIVWWLVQLGETDRETYRRIRDLAWKLAAENYDSSAFPNKLS